MDREENFRLPQEQTTIATEANRARARSATLLLLARTQFSRDVDFSAVASAVQQVTMILATSNYLVERLQAEIPRH
jgi:hypothetical protein